METLPVKQLIKMAFGTAPIMALMVITPLFILSSDIQDFNFFALWVGISGAITMAWLLNIAIVAFINYAWAKSWVRVLLVTSLMYTISFIVFYIVDPQIKIDISKVEIIRMINILSINIIIHVLIVLTLTKENKNKIALENANLKLVNLEAEYKLLKDQINPHFLFNALSTAKALVKRQPELCEEYIVRLSDFLRASINNNRKTISLKDEISLCTEFVSLNKIRFGNALQFESHIKTDPENHFVPYFSLLSLIENAVKHNVFTIESPVKITIYADDTFVEVKNNRQSKFVLEDSPKTGLKNLNDRYKLLTGNEIHIEETKDQFAVKIALLKK
jgi:two-component system LytT family sensor kinase